MEALALELAPVRVNAVTLGLMDTSLLHTAYGAERDTIMKNRAAILPGNAWEPRRRWRSAFSC
jgi:hypothetical protein